MSMNKKSGDGLSRRLWSIEIEQREDGVHFHVPPPAAADPESDDMPLNPSWQFLSPLTLRVVRLLCASGWLAREEIAQRLSEPPEGKLTTLLPDLVERCIIESSPRKGYQLSLPDDADPEQYRRDLLAWLDTQERLAGDCPP